MTTHTMYPHCECDALGLYKQPRQPHVNNCWQSEVNVCCMVFATHQVVVHMQSDKVARQSIANQTHKVASS